MSRSTISSASSSGVPPDDPLIEMLSPDLYDSPLRQELVHPEPQLENGSLPLPAEPGLGIELDEEAVARYRVTAP